jgi:alpha-L-fucosidase
LVKAAGHNSNFLLNVGPTPMGEIQSEFIDTLKKVGMWTSKYGETIYGTRGGPIAPHAWGVSTAKGNTIYVHVMDQIDAQLWLPMADKKVKKLSNFQDKMPVEFTKMKDGILVTLPAQKAGELHRILEIGI